jgi:hypothetical protein
LFAVLLIGIAPDVRGTAPDSADRSIHQFLAKDDALPSYRATRRLEAENGDRTGWLEAVTEYSPETGLSYRVTSEGGSGYIRTKVLRGVLDAEREAIARGETSRSSLDRTNYSFEAHGVDGDGLANIRLKPLRKDRVLVAGTMFLQPSEGDLVRLEGRLAKSPSFWIKDVDITRSYQRFDKAMLPVTLESTAQVRMLGPARLRMTYIYTEIDGRPIAR